jgi:hypothetical protein
MADLQLRQPILHSMGRPELVSFPVRCPHAIAVAGSLPRLHRLPSTTLVFDLQFKLRCSQWGRRSGFAISLRDERERGAIIQAVWGGIVWVPAAQPSGAHIQNFRSAFGRAANDSSNISSSTMAVEP